MGGRCDIRRYVFLVVGAGGFGLLEVGVGVGVGVVV